MNRRFSIPDLNAFLAGKGAVLGADYGLLMEATFRITHMGSMSAPQRVELLGWIDPYWHESGVTRD